MEILWLIFAVCTCIALLPFMQFIIVILIVGKIFEWMFGDK